MITVNDIGDNPGGWVASVRKSAGYSQQAFAEVLTGMGMKTYATTISRIESNAQRLTLEQALVLVKVANEIAEGRLRGRCTACGQVLP